MNVALAESTPAGLTAAIASVLVALTGLIGAVTLLIPALKRQKATAATVEHIHDLVNGQATAAVAREDQLVGVLTSAGVTVPDRPSPVPVPGEAPTPGAPDVDSSPLPPAGVG